MSIWDKMVGTFAFIGWPIWQGVLMLGAIAAIVFASILVVAGVVSQIIIVIASAIWPLALILGIVYLIVHK